LKGMIQSKPVAELMSERLSLIKIWCRSAGKSRVQNHNAIVLGVSSITIRESRISKCSVGDLGPKADSVDVDVSRSALAKFCFRFVCFSGVKIYVVEPIPAERLVLVYALEYDTTDGLIIYFVDTSLRRIPDFA
jgi:hypothetical protein